jgi:hypothetical protein
MSTINTILFSIIILFFFSCEKRSNSSNSSIKGVWEYVEDDKLNEIRGMSFFTDNHFTFLVNYTNKDSIQKVLAYAGPYSMKDSVVTATIDYAHKQSLIGQNISWIHATNGKFASYKVLDKNGKIIETGKVKKIE